MTFEEFNKQSGRLVTEWPRSYGKEKLRSLWSAFKAQTVQCMMYCIDQAISDSRYAPTVSDVKAYQPRYREMLNRQNKQRHTQDPDEFWASKYHSAEVTTIVDTIRRRLSGGMSDDDYASFLDTLEQVVKAAEKDHQIERLRR